MLRLISSRVRIARNLQHVPFPMLASNEQSEEVLNKLSEVLQYDDVHAFGDFHTLDLIDLENDPNRMVPLPQPLSASSPQPQRASSLVWASPRSLAATDGITIVFSSSGYLDVSVPLVCLYTTYVFSCE